MSARFRYRAADAAGRVVEGSLQSQSRREAIEDLRRQDLYPVDVAEVGLAVPASRATSSPLGDALAVWTRTVATMLGAGLSLERALSFSSVDATNAVLASAVTAVRGDIHGGSTLASAMRKQPRVFGQLYLAMVTAGEESGALDQVLARLADSLDEGSELRGKIRSALLYPALMAIVATMGVTVILLFVIPRFVEMLGEVGGTLPVSTRILLALSGAVAKWWWLFVVCAGGIAYAVRRWLENPENAVAWHRARLAIPITGDLERNYTTARFTRTIGLLQLSGVGILSSLRIARSAVTNQFMGMQLQLAAEAVSHGRRLSPELEGILPALAVQLLSAGEESGRLAELSLRAADNYDRDVARRLRTLISLLEPVLIVVFGVLVGFVALAMLQAIYSVNARVL